MDAAFDIDVLLERAVSVGPKATCYRPGFNQADMNIAAIEFLAKCIAQAFKCEFAAIISASIRHRRKAKN